MIPSVIVWNLDKQMSISIPHYSEMFDSVVRVFVFFFFLWCFFQPSFYIRSQLLSATVGLVFSLFLLLFCFGLLVFFVLL